MRCEDLPAISRTDFDAACRTGNTEHRTTAILRLALHHGDPEFIERACNDLLGDEDFSVRRAAVLSVGHMARLYGRVGEDTLVRLNSLSSDPAMAGTVADALDDIAIFVRP